MARPSAITTDITQLPQQLAELIRILHPDNVFLFDLLVRFLRHTRSLAESPRKRTFKFHAGRISRNWSAEQYCECPLNSNLHLNLTRSYPSSAVVHSSGTLKASLLERYPVQSMSTSNWTVAAKTLMYSFAAAVVVSFRAASMPAPFVAPFRRAFAESWIVNFVGFSGP